MTESPARTWPAPAKLNLFLHVLGRREDGYHDIQTLFQLIDLCDELTFEITATCAITRPTDSYGVNEQDDLVVRAARLLQEKTATNSGAVINVIKRIPLGAGLGGGSSDAATALLALNHLWDCKLGLSELADLGLKLGADVPVFIYGQSALATGVGEKLKAVEIGSRHYLLVFNSRSISTAEVFSHPYLCRNSAVIDFDQALAGIGVNDCESVVRLIYPEFENLFVDLEKWGKPRMTGTGSCIFLQMCDKKAAIKAADEIKSRYNVGVVRGLDRSPLHQVLRSAKDKA